MVGTGGSGLPGGTGVVANGGNTVSDYGGGDGLVANGGDFNGVGVVATGAGGRSGAEGSPGIIATGGGGSWGAASGAGVTATGGPVDAGDGIDAFATNGGLAGSFAGNVHISGNLDVSGTKSFRVDHPLEPAKKYLYHAALESSEVLNFYTGNAVLDANGEATVQLPDWFEALNGDFRYQLTPIGAGAPNLHIAQEIQNNSFRVAGGAPGLKVSWQVTAVRQDAWEKAHPMAVEVASLRASRVTTSIRNCSGRLRKRASSGRATRD